MKVHDFTGADFEPASRFLGTHWHAAQGERSYWHGAYGLCGLLSRSDHGYVATDAAGDVAGIALLASPRDEDHNRDLRMHWTQQRAVIVAVCRSLGIRLGEAPGDADGEGAADADGAGAADAGGTPAPFGPAATDAVVLFLANKNAEDALVTASRTWLTEHGVELVAPAEAGEADAPQIETSDATDNLIVEALLDGHAARQGVDFVSYDFHIPGKDGIEAGIVAWAMGPDVHIETLAVAESSRRKGLGSLLLRHVEEQAKKDGCTTASVDTFSFQAPDYYPAHGYEVVFRYPLDDGTERIYFSKRL